MVETNNSDKGVKHNMDFNISTWSNIYNIEYMYVRQRYIKGIRYKVMDSYGGSIG